MSPLPTPLLPLTLVDTQYFSRLPLLTNIGSPVFTEHYASKNSMRKDRIKETVTADHCDDPSKDEHKVKQVPMV